MSGTSGGSRGGALVRIGFGVLTVLVGLLMAVPGLWLIVLGGSWYYTLAGAGLIAAGVWLVRGDARGVLAYVIVLAATAIWAVWEAGFAVWPLVPRLIAPMVLTAIALLLAPGLDRRRATTARVGALVLALGVAGFFWMMFQPQGVIRHAFEGSGKVMEQTGAAGAEWRNYGRTPNGTRYAPFDQITPANVGRLAVAWTYRTGDPPSQTGQDQNTPLYVDGVVYHCSPHDIVSAIDAGSGEEIWRFDPKASSPLWQRCRGVTYYEPSPPGGGGTAAPTDGAGATDRSCARRIVLTTIDARLIELDAATGAACPGFGAAGTVGLTRNMGEVKPGFYFPTSAPTVMGDRIIVGGWVWDGMAVDEPSGVVRAFDARTGELSWAWDMGDPSIHTVPPPGKTYTRGTPNVWSTPSFDEELGLVFLPTGNAQPDFYGSLRSEAANTYSSSVVALDAATGAERWRFQTTHRDTWDYDVPSQPMLYDIPDGKGGTIPALIQLTKRGQTFVLDRRDGTPLAEVTELPVPTTGGVESDYPAKTQPYSVGLPAVGAEPLSEARMWGATPLDQLYCRIAFRLSDYDGDVTPLSTRGTLIWPGYFGGMNWGTGTIDEGRGLLVVNDARIVHKVQLVPRAEADALGPAGAHDGLAPQTGAPYAAIRSTFLSPLGVPCQEPPFGTLSAIDLATRTLVWQVPIGTVEETGPFGIRTGLRMPVGMPPVGGPISTASGLTFYAGTQDYYLRAFDTMTGEELWRGALPVGSQATPMSYVTPDGRQFIVVSVGGLSDAQGRGDYVIAFALPTD
ncbi:MAG: membrane-bound PQQ-dependent dehydrogenase, glucose/quinate/shikimate family [Bauldia sp.]|nr:membrane-bound PQQ-dependent dehydrogenase, glucose/quinate/shikimate family [Bauldia sp.]